MHASPKNKHINKKRNQLAVCRQESHVTVRVALVALQRTSAFCGLARSTFPLASHLFRRTREREQARKQIHLLHHGALMTCRHACVTHFQLRYECFMSSSGTFAGTMTLTIVFFSDLVWRADDWSAIGTSNVGRFLESAAKKTKQVYLLALLSSLSEMCLP